MDAVGTIIADRLPRGRAQRMLTGQVALGPTIKFTAKRLLQYVESLMPPDLPKHLHVKERFGFFSRGWGRLKLRRNYAIRKYYFHSDYVVDKHSGAYLGGAVTGAAIGTAIGGIGAAVADGKNGAFFGRGGALFNQGPIRFGWSWEGSAQAGRDVIRLGIGAARGTSWWSHIPLYYP
jgi:hypothetical protein